MKNEFKWVSVAASWFLVSQSWCDFYTKHNKVLLPYTIFFFCVTQAKFKNFVIEDLLLLTIIIYKMLLRFSVTIKLNEYWAVILYIPLFALSIEGYYYVIGIRTKKNNVINDIKILCG